jgi:hypothetical protein
MMKFSGHCAAGKARQRNIWNLAMRRGQRSLGRNGLIAATFVLALLSAPAGQATDIDSFDG